MFLIRRAKIEDASTLVRLAKLVHFINLPADRDVIAAKIIQSRNAFNAAGQLLHQPDEPARSVNARSHRPRQDDPSRNGSAAPADAPQTETLGLAANPAIADAAAVAGAVDESSQWLYWLPVHQQIRRLSQFPRAL